MACDWPAQRIELYLGGFLSDAENQAFEEHLLICAECQRYINLKCASSSYTWEPPPLDDSPTVH